MSFLLRLVRNLTFPKYPKNIILSSVNLANGIQECSRSFHCSSYLSVRMFMEHENKYAYSILEDKGYAVSLNCNIQQQSLTEEQFQEALKVDWSKRAYSEIIEIFPKLALYSSEHNLSISNKIFDTYIDHLTDCLQLASDKELEFVFYALNKWPETESIRTRNHIEVWAALDDECLNRITNWSYNELLSFIALFYMINVTRYSEFSNKSLNKLASKAKQLTPGQIVQTMFFIGVWRKSPFDMHNLEIEINQKYSLFTVDDIAIMCMGFFKSKTPVRNMDLILKMIDTVIANSKTIHEVSLAALLKLIRYSTKCTVDDRIYRLLNTLQHEVPRLSVMCNVHIALVGTSTLNLHEKCLHKIAETVIQSMAQARIKDLERLVLSYGTFNLIPQTKECFFSKVMDELRSPERRAEIATHGRSFACCIAYLSLLGIHPVDLINKVLSQEFLEQTYGKYFYNYGREILTLNNVAELFCSDSQVNRLQNKYIQVLAKKFTDYIPSEDYVKNYNVTERMVLDIMKVLKETRGGNEYVVGEHVLAHHQRGDVIICNDQSGSPVPVKDAFPTKEFGLLRKPPNDNHWIALVIAGRNAIINNTDNATGFFTSKIKQLEALGYHAALVPWSKYIKLKSTEEKASFLNSLINDSLRKK
ncbi:hypothetical protein PYW07_015947 [Mythimna separata]|uniref:RAP domain-containing protein n=1 Tax=Mythimna separata TaxID=271217 RepID=A0AAD8DUW9_MYTSE|nr:hypothetical protein PYW07_015947 [Mythimna separata]